MTHSRSVPVALRPVVLVARMAALPEITPPEEIARILATFTPPIDPASPEWAALRAALDHYDATQDRVDFNAARRRVIIAAVTLLAGPTHHGASDTPAWYTCQPSGHLPARTPRRTIDTDPTASAASIEKDAASLREIDHQPVDSCH